MCALKLQPHNRAVLIIDVWAPATDSDIAGLKDWPRWDFSKLARNFNTWLGLKTIAFEGMLERHFMKCELAEVYSELSLRFFFILIYSYISTWKLISSLPLPPLIL